MHLTHWKGGTMAELKYTNWNSSVRRGGHLRKVGVALIDTEAEPVMVIDDEPEDSVADRTKDKSAE